MASAERAVAGPQAGFAADGTAVVVWSGSDNGADAIRASEHAPGAPAFSTPQTISLPSVKNFVYAPALAVAPDGEAIAAWAQKSGVAVESMLYVALRSPAGTWSNPVQIDGGGLRQYPEPSVAITAAGDALVVWYDALHAAIESRSHSAAGAWGDIVTLSRPDELAMSPRVVMDASGTATVIWLQTDDGARPNVVAWAEHPLAGSWTAPQELTTFSLGAASQPELAVNPAGRVVAVWNRDQLGRIDSASLLRPAGWSAVTQLGTPTADDEPASVDVDAAGDAIAAFSSAAGAIDVNRERPGQAWGAPEPATAPPGSAFGASAQPSVSVAPDGRGLVGWWASAAGTFHTLAAAGDLTAWGDGVDLGASAAQQYGVDTAVDERGNGLAVYNIGSLQASVYDDAGPDISRLSVPANATAGQPATFSLAATDRWTHVASVQWTFGDGAAASGASASHAYSSAGSFTITATATDTLGDATTDTRTVSVAPAPVAPPLVRSLSVTRASLSARFARSRIAGAAALRVTGAFSGAGTGL